MLSTEENKQYLSKSTLWLMAIGAGLVVANIYYNQPLLGMIANEFGQSESATSRVAMFTQIGYAAGLLLIIPLGDMFKRKKIILIDFFFIIISPCFRSQQIVNCNDFSQLFHWADLCCPSNICTYCSAVIVTRKKGEKCRYCDEWASDRNTIFTCI